MKITAYLDPNCRHSTPIRAIVNKYNLCYEERDATEIRGIQGKVNQDSRQDALPRIEVNGSILVDVSGKAFEDYLLKKGLVEPVDRKPKKTLLADEEQEAIRSETVRFF